MELAATGHTDTLISQELGISEATVATYWGRIRTKLGPLNRTELVANYVREQTHTVIHELREKNRTLIEALEERSGHQWGEEDVAYYRGLILGAPDAVLIVDADGRIESANVAASELFGYEPGFLEGQSLKSLIPDRYHTTHTGHLSTYFAHADRRRMGEHLATVALHRLGRELPIAATLAPVESPSGMRVMCMIRPV